MKQPAEPTHSLLQVRVHPRSAKSRHAWKDGDLHVWVTAPAVEGAANRAIQQYLAAALRIAPSRVLIDRGQTSRTKQLCIELDEATVQELLQDPLK